MTRMNRRRFLTISAAAATFAGQASANAPLHQWQGVALGAAASITLAHPDSENITARAQAEINRLESIFSLYRADSALSRLNAQGTLTAPPFELLECLGLCGAVNAATEGLFDPTVQPLWALYAEHYSKGTAPDAADIARTLPLVGWNGLEASPEAIRFARPGMALTLNGVAQGYIADRVAALLRAEGLTDILIDTGELRALGGHPYGGGWPVSLASGEKVLPNALILREQALASSAPLGTVFDADGRVGHILHPKTGLPTTAKWNLVSVTAPSAALADALTTAMCLKPRGDIDTALRTFPGAKLAYLG